MIRLPSLRARWMAWLYLIVKPSYSVNDSGQASVMQQRDGPRLSSLA